jgi:hypothetical protein
MNADNLDARIMRNGALDQKIWALETYRGKTDFSGGSGVILEFFEQLEGIGAKERGSCDFGGFFWNFGRVYSGLGRICK